MLRLNQADSFISFIALQRPQALHNCHITHIVSVLEWQFDADNPLTRGFQHLHIPVDDVEEENLLVWFPRSNAFIMAGLDHWRASRDSTAPGHLEASDGHRESGVLIHCAMGKSRSATILLAYLLWSSRQPQSEAPNPHDDDDMVPLPQKPFSVIEALTLLRQGRPIAEPNEGFMDQLYLYEDMGCPTTQSELESHRLYRRWMNKRNVAESLAINQAPDTEDIKFEDESEDETEGEAKGDSPQAAIAPGVSAPTGTEPPSSQPNANSLASTSPATPHQQDQDQDLLLKCRKCRHLLARSNFILPHSPLHSDPSAYAPISQDSPDVPSDSPSSATASHQCAHIFLHPLSWMKAALATGQLEGRLTCPNAKCAQNIGKFAWQGLRCSCGGWVTPAFAVARGRVDEVRTLAGVGRARGAVAGDEKARATGNVGADSQGVNREAAVRYPPGMKRGGKI